jgi:4-hydroxybenzoyl-CoA thioesterase
MNEFPDSTSDARDGVGTYTKEVLVRFSDCDPAGIVFYPKYFEMFNSLIEDWCRDQLRFSFNEIVTRRGWGLPTVHLEVDFPAPSSFGDTLRATLALRSVGKSSIGVDMTLRGPDGAFRVKGKAVLVLTNRATNRPIPLPAELRERLLGSAGATVAKTRPEDP